MKPTLQTPTWRIIDANANRALEGLRVVEEYARFVLDDPHLTQLYKQLRHDLASGLERLSGWQRMAARDTQLDVGTSASTDQELHRASDRGVVEANQKRIEQSLRCLEEYGKLVDLEFAISIEAMRYRAYTLAKALLGTIVGAQRLEKARLYVLLDGRPSSAEFASLAGELIQAGVDVIQLRDKRLADRELLERARSLRTLSSGTNTLFIMNDRPDLAVLSGADGVHVGQQELTVKDVRRIVGAEMLIGVSTHSIEQARQAVLAGASYLGCGPTFPSQTKSFADFPGLPFLRQVATEIRLPAFAIGGITLENLGQVLETGVSKVAVRGSVIGCNDPAGAAAALRNVLRGGAGGRGAGERVRI